MDIFPLDSFPLDIFPLEKLPVDIITSIVQYTPAENIMLSGMSKILRKVVLKSGFSIEIMHIFYMNRYGFIWDSSRPNRKIHNIFIPKNISPKKFSDEFCCYMYEYGERVKYILMRDPRKYLKKCLQRNDSDSITLSIISFRDLPDKMYEIIQKHGIKSGIVNHEYYGDDDFDLGDMAIRNGVTDDEIAIINDYPSTTSRIYETFKTKNYKIIDKIIDKIIGNLGKPEINDYLKIIRKDDLDLFKILLDKFNILVDTLSVCLKHIYEYDAINIFKYVYKTEQFQESISELNILKYSAPKIARFIHMNKITGVHADIYKAYIFKQTSWTELYIPDSKILNSVKTIEYFMPEFIEEEKIKLPRKTIIQMYRNVILTPHSYPFVNQFITKLYQILI